MSESNPSAVRWSRLFAGAACVAIAGLVSSTPAAAGDGVSLVMEVAWADDRCDFVVTKNAAGHGIAMRLTPLALRAGDVLVGELDAIGYGRKIEKQGTDASGMMQIRKYGIRRKIALDFVYEWSRQCNPPEE